MAAALSLCTDRLTLDPWTAADGKLLADLARTPAVMRYVGDGTTWTDARIHGVAEHILAHLTVSSDRGWPRAARPGAPA